MRVGGGTDTLSKEEDDGSLKFVLRRRGGVVEEAHRILSYLYYSTVMTPLLSLSLDLGAALSARVPQPVRLVLVQIQQ